MSDRAENPLYRDSPWNFRPAPLFTCMTGEERATNILRELHAAEEELIGKGVVTTGGKAGTINHIYLDEAHGLRISISGHDGEWPISTVKFIES